MQSGETDVCYVAVVFLFDGRQLNSGSRRGESHGTEEASK